mgnify:CR=1 FL=1
MKPSGNIELNRLTTLGSWALDIPRTPSPSCLWKEIFSNNFVGNGPANIDITLYNAGLGDGNNLAIDNVRIVEIAAQNSLAFDVLLQPDSSSGQAGLAITVSGTFAPAGMYCIDYYYLYLNGVLVLQGIATPTNNGQEITFSTIPQGYDRF